MTLWDMITNPSITLEHWKLNIETTLMGIGLGLMMGITLYLKVSLYYKLGIAMVILIVFVMFTVYSIAQSSMIFQKAKAEWEK
jgi:hypothetical protein